MIAGRIGKTKQEERRAEIRGRAKRNSFHAGLSRPRESGSYSTMPVRLPGSFARALASTCLPCRPIDGLEGKASIIVEVFARPWRRIGCYIGANDYRPSHRRDRGVGRETCES